MSFAATTTVWYSPCFSVRAFKGGRPVVSSVGWFYDQRRWQPHLHDPFALPFMVTWSNIEIRFGSMSQFVVYTDKIEKETTSSHFHCSSFWFIPALRFFPKGRPSAAEVALTSNATPSPSQWQQPGCIHPWAPYKMPQKMVICSIYLTLRSITYRMSQGACLAILTRMPKT